MNSLDSWYSISGLSNTTYSQYIDSSIGFCSDRNTESGYSWSYNNTVYYAAHGRLISNKSPSLVCNSSDILQIPIGLITADEVAFAGGVYGQSNSTYYLFNNQVYWTMSPCNFSSGSAYVFKVALDGNIISYDGVYSQSGVRPVINLKSDTKFDGSGTSTDPFTVVD